MNLNFLKTQFFLITALAVTSASTVAAQTYQVTIKNLTSNQIFTGIHFRVHGSRSRLFQTGSLMPESSLQFFYPSFLLEETSDDESIHVSLNPGTVLSFQAKAKKRQKFLSLIAPLHATDDGFVGIDSIPLPTKRSRSVLVGANVYDAGLFENTESCDANTILTSLRPPEECSQSLKENVLQPKMPVVVHNGIHGIGDLSSHKYDWKNPAAEIVIEKVSSRK